MCQAWQPVTFSLQHVTVQRLTWVTLNGENIFSLNQALGSPPDILDFNLITDICLRDVLSEPIVVDKFGQVAHVANLNCISTLGSFWLVLNSINGGSDPSATANCCRYSSAFWKAGSVSYRICPPIGGHGLSSLHSLSNILNRGRQHCFYKYFTIKGGGYHLGIFSLCIYRQGSAWWSLRFHGQGGERYFSRH